MTLILSVFILIPLVIEGLGIFSQITYLSYYYFILPIALLIFSLIKKKPIHFPTAASICFILFLIFSLISALNFSVDKQISFEWWLFYLANFLIFIFFYNFKLEAKKIIKSVIVIATAIFIAAFLLKVLFPNFFLIKNLPAREFNLFFSFYTYAHNHLGDFLGLSLIMILAGLVKNMKKTSLILFFILIIFFFYSFSRSAYLSFSLIITIFIFQFRNRHMTIFFSTTLFLVIAFFLLISSPYGKLFDLPQKNLFDSRENYWQQGMQAIKEKPVFGFGMGNFGYASQKYRDNYSTFSETVHNFLLENFSENGFLTTLPLIIFLILILLSVWRRQSVFSLLFFYLFFIFQTDYIYRMYSVMVLFMILEAVVYEEKNNGEYTKVFGIMALFLYLILQMIIMSNILIYNNKFKLAAQIYPLNKTVYPLLIQQQLLVGNSTGAINTANKYQILAPRDEVTLQTLGLTYEILGRKNEALNYYKQICQLNIYCHPFWINKTVSLIKELYSKGEIFTYLQDRIDVYKNAGYLTDQLENEIESEVKKTCLDMTGDKECYFLNINKLKYFYEPEANTIKKEIKKPYKATYTINKDALNERFNYPVKKEKSVYRIMILGDSLAYGPYIDTSKNWTELLEDKLNKDKNRSNIKKFEVINLGVDGYDIEYTIERYKTRGERYDPDLIIWPIRSFYRINELMRRKIKLFEENNLERLNEDQIWEKAKNEIRDELGYKTMRKAQKKQVGLLPQNSLKKIIFINTGEINGDEKEVFPLNPKIFEAIIPDDEYYPETGALNPQGHKAFAEEIFKKINVLVRQ